MDLYNLYGGSTIIPQITPVLKKFKELNRYDTFDDFQQPDDL